MINIILLIQQFEHVLLRVFLSLIKVETLWSLVYIFYLTKPEKQACLSWWHSVCLLDPTDQIDWLGTPAPVQPLFYTYRYLMLHVTQLSQKCSY